MSYDSRKDSTDVLSERVRVTSRRDPQRPALSASIYGKRELIPRRSFLSLSRQTFSNDTSSKSKASKQTQKTTNDEIEEFYKKSQSTQVPLAPGHAVENPLSIKSGNNISGKTKARHISEESTPHRENIEHPEKCTNDPLIDLSDQSYHDYSRTSFEKDKLCCDLLTGIFHTKTPKFPVILHRILSKDEYKDIAYWLPHGRSWRVVDPKKFEEIVIPKYFRHAQYSSFARQVNGWGFCRVNKGPDFNSYYHELFLRGLPHLCLKMGRPGKRLTKTDHVYVEAPNFYKLSEKFPVPEYSQTEELGQVDVNLKSKTSKRQCRNTGSGFPNKLVFLLPEDAAAEESNSKLSQGIGTCDSNDYARDNEESDLSDTFRLYNDGSKRFVTISHNHDQITKSTDGTAAFNSSLKWTCDHNNYPATQSLVDQYSEPLEQCQQLDSCITNLAHNVDCSSNACSLACSQTASSMTRATLPFFHSNCSNNNRQAIHQHHYGNHELSHALINDQSGRRGTRSWHELCCSLSLAHNNVSSLAAVQSSSSVCMPRLRNHFSAIKQLIGEHAYNNNINGHISPANQEILQPSMTSDAIDISFPIWTRNGQTASLQHISNQVNNGSSHLQPSLSTLSRIPSSTQHQQFDILNISHQSNDRATASNSVL